MAVEDQPQAKRTEKGQKSIPSGQKWDTQLGLPAHACWELVWRGVRGLWKRHRTGSRENENTKTTGDCSESLVIREIEPVTVKGCLTPRTDLMEKGTETSAGKDVEKLETSDTAGGNQDDTATVQSSYLLLYRAEFPI